MAIGFSHITHITSKYEHINNIVHPNHNPFTNSNLPICRKKKHISSVQKPLTSLSTGRLGGFPTVKYPLVNIQKTTEITMFNGKIHYFDWAILSNSQTVDMTRGYWMAKLHQPRGVKCSHCSNDALRRVPGRPHAA